MNKKAVKMGTLIGLLKPYFTSNPDMKPIIKIDDIVYDAYKYRENKEVDMSWFWNSFNKEVVVQIWLMIAQSNNEIIIELSTKNIYNMEVVSGNTISLYDFVSLFDFQLNEYDASPFIGVIYDVRSHKYMTNEVTDMLVPYFQFNESAMSHPNYKVQLLSMIPCRKIPINIDCDDPLFDYIKYPPSNLIIKVIANFIPQGMTHNLLCKNTECIANNWP